jgi:hypothetical protein
LTGRDIVAHARVLAADPHFETRFCQLADLREVTAMDVTTPGIRQLVGANPFGAGARRAVVVCDDVVYGMARMVRADAG